MLKDLETNNSDQESRDEEVGKFNNTMLADRDVTLFTYYWKLENVTERLKDSKLNIIRSPGFSIKGNKQIKIWLNKTDKSKIIFQENRCNLNAFSIT